MEWNGIIGLISVATGMGLGFALRTVMAKMQAQSIERQASSRRTEADRDAKSIRREAEIQARAEVLRVREKFEQEVKEQRHNLETLRDHLTKREAGLVEREENLDRKASVLDRKEQSIDRKLDAADAKLASAEETRAAVAAREKEVARAAADATAQLQRLAGMTRDEARRTLFDRTEREVRGELGTLVRRLQEEARATADAEARDVILGAVYRYGRSHASESLTTVVPIADDTVKGHVIGRDGRNIRALEAATGVSFLMDDTPGAIVISAFDPVRREIARRTLVTLLEDGRIHPVRIEEVAARVRDGMETALSETGAAVAAELDLQGLAPDVLRAVGRLRFRTSFSQNVLDHSKEVASLMGMMAAEIGLDAAVARRVGLLHDIGKALDHEVEGAHASIGAALLRQNGEAADVVAGVEFHHDKTESSAYAMLCATADAISSARPGARIESSEIFLNRVQKLEEIATSCEGVRKAYAVQAGRELRVIVDPESVGDAEAVVLARDISKRIEGEVKFPGQIRVTVIRETRCVEYAR